MPKKLTEELPIQPVDTPIICSPFTEPSNHWVYQEGRPFQAGSRRKAGYWYKAEKTGSVQGELIVEEQRDDLPLVNFLRDDVRQWRQSGYRGAGHITRELLEHWSSENLYRPLFFCQREAVETIIYLAEIRIQGKSNTTRFRNFQLTDEALQKLLRGENPNFASGSKDFYPTLLDKSADADFPGFTRLGCKMATGSGKTVVMAMLIAWAFCNRGRNPTAREFPKTVLVCCPNLTVKERLQVLKPENKDNYFEEFDIVPTKYRSELNKGKFVVTNWHTFAPESPQKEGEKSYKIVNKGEETPETIVRRVVGDSIKYGPIMVLNDEGHHCWRGNTNVIKEDLTREERTELNEDKAKATIWVEGLDQINAYSPSKGRNGIAFCVDLSATPFYIKGSGHSEGTPFPWIVSDFALVDAIECGIVKIPRLPVLDTTQKPDPKYFKIWQSIKDELSPDDYTSKNSGKPKPEVVYKKAEPALVQIAGQWVERFKYIEAATPGLDKTPNVLIIVCDNTDIADEFYRQISGEKEIDKTNLDEVSDELSADDTGSKSKKGRSKSKKTTVYENGRVFPDFFSNTPEEKRTIRIDSKLLAEVDNEDSTLSRREQAEELRTIISTVGKIGKPGEKVRCVVSVSMLTEGWDANNVTQIFGVRAFGSQLLCEQVVGRGLRRMDYTVDPETKLLHPEYVDVYGIPFSVIPFKGREEGKKQPEDRPKQHVQACKERGHMEMRFPRVEGYIMSLEKNLIECDVDSMERLVIQPDRQPTATYVSPTVGYKTGSPDSSREFSFLLHDRAQYYKDNHIQSIMFLITQMIVDSLVSGISVVSERNKRVKLLQARHQLFPQVFERVEKFVDTRVDYNGSHQCELGLQLYVEKLVERFLDAIKPNTSKGEPPLIPIINRYNPIGSTKDVNFKTIRPCVRTVASHIDQVVLDAKIWEAIATQELERSVKDGFSKFYARNDNLGLEIPYDYEGKSHKYIPDFIVRLNVPHEDVTLILEIKGREDDQEKAKYQAASKWVDAVNNWGQLGRWCFHVCYNPHTLRQELKLILESVIQASSSEMTD